MMANRRNTKVQYPSPDQNPLSSGPRRDIIELIVSQSAHGACFVLNLSSPAIPHISLFHTLYYHWMSRIRIPSLELLRTGISHQRDLKEGELLTLVLFVVLILSRARCNCRHASVTPIMSSQPSKPLPLATHSKGSPLTILTNIQNNSLIRFRKFFPRMICPCILQSGPCHVLQLFTRKVGNHLHSFFYCLDCVVF
jgi:hypothetical protein